MWALDLCDLEGRRRAFIHEHAGFRITPRINGYAEVGFEMDILGPAAAELAVAERAIKLWQDGELKFHGQVWEPLTYTPTTIVVVARDPLATWETRRVHPEDGGPISTYTAEDAGAIAHSRLAEQNNHRHTGLVAGVLEASVDRDRHYLSGQREDEILAELAAAEDGFFYRVTPLDDDPGIRGQLDILYPDAGTTREDVRFEYGAGTVANLDGFEMVRRLPLNRMVVASSASDGGRIHAVAEDAASILRYGLFEDEEVYSDVTDIGLLGEQARAGVRPNPPRTFSLAPGPDAPLLFTDFNVGDFVRLRIDHGPLDLFVWVRVLEATLVVDVNGVERLEGLVVETLTGSRLAAPHNPADRFRARLDDDRRRREALERRVEGIEQTPASEDSASTPDEPDATAPPEDPAPLPPPPPPAPPPPPTLTNLRVSDNGDESFTAAVDVNGNGQPTFVSFSADGGIGAFGDQATGPGFASPAAQATGLGGVTYNVTASAQSAGGTVSVGPVAITVAPTGGGV